MSAAESKAIAGRYKLLRRLGSGGMSTVHLAIDMRLERQVAVKLLAEHLADDPAFVSRFQREAQSAARLIHPHIVQIFDSGLDERTGQHFIVMEYIEGFSCAEILREHGWVEVPEAAAIIEQACEGLNYAHRKGVIHRDVKPGNLLRSVEGQVKLADFGIAKAAEQSSITQVGSVLGTAAYLAPEQARGEEAGPAADIYALGVVAYQLISGRLPYEAGSLTELALRQQEEEPPRLDQIVAGVSPELASAVACALALNPEERFRDAGEMGAAVRAGARGEAHSPPGHRAVPSDHTQATSLLNAPAARQTRRGQTAAQPIRPLQPRPGPLPLQESGGATGAVRRRRRTRQALSLLVGAALIGGSVAAYLELAAPKTTVALRKVVYNNLNETAGALRELVAEDTR